MRIVNKYITPFVSEFAAAAAGRGQRAGQGKGKGQGDLKPAAGGVNHHVVIVRCAQTPGATAVLRAPRVPYEFSDMGGASV